MGPFSGVFWQGGVARRTVEQLRMERTSRWHLDDAGKWINSNPDVRARVSAEDPKIARRVQ